MADADADADADAWGGSQPYARPYAHAHAHAARAVVKARSSSAGLTVEYHSVRLTSPVKAKAGASGACNVCGCGVVSLETASSGACSSCSASPVLRAEPLTHSRTRTHNVLTNPLTHSRIHECAGYPHGVTDYGEPSGLTHYGQPNGLSD